MIQWWSCQKGLRDGIAIWNTMQLRSWTWTWWSCLKLELGWMSWTWTGFELFLNLLSWVLVQVSWQSLPFCLCTCHVAPWCHLGVVAWTSDLVCGRGASDLFWSQAQEDQCSSGRWEGHQYSGEPCTSQTLQESKTKKGCQKKKSDWDLTSFGKRDMPSAQLHLLGLITKV